MKTAIRLDDITGDMDWGKFLRFKELLDRYDIKPLIGVIPQNEDETINGDQNGAPEDFWEYISVLQNAGWTVSMHGAKHIYSSKKGGMFPLNDFSEFAGRPYDEQYRDIMTGVSFLKEKGIDTDMFMAPAHSYDDNTIRALKSAGFSKITDGFGNGPYIYKGITFYPISFRRSSSLKKKDGYTTFVVHTNTLNEDDLKWYEDLFSKKRDDLISFDEYLKVTPSRRGSLGHIAEYMMALTKHYLIKAR